MKRILSSITMIALLALTACGGQFQFEAASLGELASSEEGESRGRRGGERSDQMPEIQCNPDTENCLLLCHVPPGNPEARHAILVGESGAHAHLTNHDSGEHSHDYLGPCLDDETQAELNL